MAKKLYKKQNTKEIIEKLKEKGRVTGQAFWRTVAKKLEKPRRLMPKVNIEKLDVLGTKHSNKIFIVPGKVLGKGKLSKPVKVCALTFSERAKSEITKNKGEAITFDKLMEKEVKGKEVMIIQ